MSSVRFIVKMAARAMGLAGVQRRRSCPAKNVLLVSDGLKMRRVHTKGIAAKVIEFEPFGGWSDKQHVRNPVREVRASVVVNLPIPHGLCAGLPNPTVTVASASDLSPKTLFNRFWRRHFVSIAPVLDRT